MVSIRDQIIVLEMRGSEEDLYNLIQSLLSALGSQDENTMLSSTEVYHITNLIRELIPDMTNPAFRVPHGKENLSKT